MVIIKMAGTSGSGKTSVVRALIKGLNMTPLGDGPKPEAYVAPAPWSDTVERQLVVLGPYVNVCGGMDCLTNQSAKMALLTKYAAAENVVVFEGLITGGTYGEMGELSETPGHKGRWIYAFMDTPLKVCSERVLSRRLERGNVKPFDPYRTLAPKHKYIARLAERVTELGHTVMTLHHELRPIDLADQLLVAAHDMGILSPEPLDQRPDPEATAHR